MTQINFYGRITTGDVAVVRELMRSWLGVERLDEKVKLSGEQLVYEDAEVYAYAYAAGGAQFLLEGHRRAALEEVAAWLQRLLAWCVVRGVAASLEYVAVDDEGEEISEQFEVALPSA